MEKSVVFAFLRGAFFSCGCLVLACGGNDGGGGVQGNSAGTSGSAGSSAAAGGAVGMGGSPAGGSGGAPSGSGGSAGSGDPADAGVHDDGGGSGGGAGTMVVDAAAEGGRDATSEAAGEAGGSKQVLMVGLSSGKPSPGDTVMINHLEARGFKITLVADTAITPTSANGKDLIVISSSEESGNLGTKLRDLAIPTVCMEDGSFADMKMASARGQAIDQLSIKFVGNGPLTAGLSGTVAIAANSPAGTQLGWGTVGAKAMIAASTVGDPAQVVVFGYEKGDDMVGMTAPARRAGFAAREGIAAHFTPEGLAVLDAEIDWVLGQK